jgi:MoaA/NifB/PqqE/SkfB family radical SAM enzyme
MRFLSSLTRRAPVDPGVDAAILLPMRSEVRAADLGETARAILSAILEQAQGVFAARVPAIAIDVEARVAWTLADGRRVRTAEIARGYRLLCNAAFLLADPPPVAELRQASARGLACCGSRPSGDLQAVAFARGALSGDGLWPWLAALVAVGGDEAAIAWRRDALVPTIASAPSHPDRSPSVAGVTLESARPAPEAPRYLNAALRELFATAPPEPDGAASALEALLRRSRVPWIFNSLLNEVEYQTGAPEPRALPPEVHLSLTGVCNIECRFCGYTHDTARFNRVTLEQVQQLEFLRSMRVLRLNSGLGEPTADPHLAPIVEWTADRFPHLVTNFFTNGINLHGQRLLDAIVGRVRWISVSINAASSATWREVCQADFFERVLRNLRDLQAAKRAAGTPFPLVYATMVLQGANLDDLPRMPAICRAQGVDRFTGFPYFGLGFDGPQKYGPEQTLAAVRARYEALYDETIREAAAHEVSIELPLPESEKSVSFGLERRGFHDFARVETNEWPLARFLAGVVPAPDRSHCHFLWRQAAIGSTYHGQSKEQTHYLYPCLGPLSSVDLSRHTAFRFAEAASFEQLWRNPVFTVLRRGQREPGVSPVCDACRTSDTRDPAHFERLSALVQAFTTEHAAS